jgi:hypothetical protein
MSFTICDLVTRTDCRPQDALQLQVCDCIMSSAQSGVQKEITAIRQVPSLPTEPVVAIAPDRQHRLCCVGSEASSSTRCMSLVRTSSSTCANSREQWDWIKRKAFTRRREYSHPRIYRRTDNSWSVSFSVSAWVWVYASNLPRLRIYKRERNKQTERGKSTQCTKAEILLPQRLNCYWRKIVSLRMLTNLRLPDLRLATEQQRSSGQNLPSYLYHTWGKDQSPTTVALGYYEMDRRGNTLFSTASRLALGPTQPLIHWMPEDLSPKVRLLGHEAEHLSPSTAEAKNGGAVPPLMSSWHSG